MRPLVHPRAPSKKKARSAPILLLLYVESSKNCLFVFCNCRKVVKLTSFAFQKGWLSIFLQQFKGGLQVFVQLLRGGLQKSMQYIFDIPMQPCILQFEDFHESSECLRLICEALTKNLVVDRMRLWHCKLDETFLQLMLCENSILQTINIIGNNMTSEAVNILAKGLCKNSTLEKLYLMN